ncbi:hypothetical protein Tco_1136105 [Tanacetum coccineum]
MMSLRRLLLRNGSMYGFRGCCTDGVSDLVGCVMYHGEVDTVECDMVVEVMCGYLGKVLGRMCVYLRMVVIMGVWGNGFDIRVEDGGKFLGDKCMFKFVGCFSVFGVEWGVLKEVGMGVMWYMEVKGEKFVPWKNTMGIGMFGRERRKEEQIVKVAEVCKERKYEEIEGSSRARQITLSVLQESKTHSHTVKYRLHRDCTANSILLPGRALSKHDQSSN